MKALIGLVLGLMAAQAQAGCGPDPQPCRTPDGSYHLVLPDGVGTTPPAVVFLHGFGATGEAMLRNTGITRALLARGYAVIAPDGLPRAGRQGLSWAFHPDRPGPRNEGRFIQAVADNAAARFGLNRDRMLLAGFSIGGSMASSIACDTPRAFRAYAPIGGSFWRPHPAACAGAVRVLHTHGWKDQTVPLEGRVLGSGFAQGDVFDALRIWRETNGCPHAPDSFANPGAYQIRSWTRCTSGARIDFALHPGGHSIPPGWSDMALDWFEALP